MTPIELLNQITKKEGFEAGLLPMRIKFDEQTLIVDVDLCYVNGRDEIVVQLVRRN